MTVLFRTLGLAAVVMLLGQTHAAPVGPGSLSSQRCPGNRYTYCPRNEGPQMAACSEIYNSATRIWAVSWYLVDCLQYACRSSPPRHPH